MLRECFCGEESRPCAARQPGGCPTYYLELRENGVPARSPIRNGRSWSLAKKQAARTLRVTAPIPCSQPRSMMTNPRHARLRGGEFKIPILSRKREKDGAPLVPLLS